MYFFSKTNNPRPTFHIDKSDEERAIMQKHAVYWSEIAARGTAIVLGPVMDPQGVYGILVCQVQDEAEMRELIKHDPAYGLLRYEVFLMHRAVVGTISS
jgi:hypothetical protein